MTTTSSGPSAVGAMLTSIDDVGRDPRGGHTRLAWTDADLTLRDWFAEQAAHRSMDLAVDRAGNTWAWWGDPDADGPGVVTGSHLDSVPRGGAFDGPLGVVSAFAAVDALRARGVRPAVPLGVVCFADEEGSRFGLACLGSRLLTGAVDPAAVLARRDADGTSLADALRRAGRPVGGTDGPDGPAADPEAVRRVGTFVELHVEQGRALARGDGAAVGVGAGIWPHGRWRVDLHGQGNHAGTTPLDDRVDPVVRLAELVMAVRAEAARHGALGTVGRVVVEPNGVNVIASHVTAWLDARAPDETQLRALLTALGEYAPELESWTAATPFDAALVARLRGLVGDVLDPSGPDAATSTSSRATDVPVLRTGAGHDAGVLATAGVPTAMLLVRNPTGVSHAPEEHVEPADAEAGVRALAAVLEDLTGASGPAAGGAT